MIFCVPTVPYEGCEVRDALEIAREALAKYGFEPILIVGCISERVIYLNVDIAYDRDVPGEDEKALQCHDEMLDRLVESRYIPYRLGLQSYGFLTGREEGYTKLVGDLKKALDPNNILAPGRYGMGSRGKSAQGTHRE